MMAELPRVGRDEPVVPTVREARVDEAGPLSETLAGVFTTDPILRWMVPGLMREARLRKLFSIELVHCVFPAGRALTTDGFRGGNLELPPGGWEMAVPPSAALGLLGVFGMRLPRAGRLQKLFERTHPREPHYYVRYLGVAAQFRGKGLGTALLRATLDRCDTEGVAAYIEASSERSAALYERLGFVHLGELRIPDGPRFWPMRRPHRERHVAERLSPSRSRSVVA
jgi:GNAT superfamily N-acetyltransferase